MKFSRKLLVPPDTKVRLAEYDLNDTLGHQNDKKCRTQLARTIARLDDLQYLFYAQKKWALLIVLQAIDLGGKDGTIRHVMSGINPQGCNVFSVARVAVHQAFGPDRSYG